MRVGRERAWWSRAVQATVSIATVAVSVTVGLGGTATVGAAAELTLQPVRTIGGPGHAGLYGWGATTMRDGSVLIGDYWNRRVLHYATNGGYLGAFIDNAGYTADQHQSPYGLGVDPDTGDVYMADTDRRQVDRYSESGVFLNSFGINGKSGTTPGMFRYPSRVAVHSGLVLIADTWSNRIVAYRPTGTVEEWAFGTTGSAPGQFKQPRGMDFDAAGRLFVADQGNKRVQVFDVDAANNRLVFVRAFGMKYNATATNPPADAVFRGDLRGLAVDDANGTVFVVDGEGNRIHKFTTDGVYLTSWGSNGSGNGQFVDGGREVTVDGAGQVWVGDMPNFRVQVFTNQGAFLPNGPNPPRSAARRAVSTAHVVSRWTRPATSSSSTPTTGGSPSSPRTARRSRRGGIVDAADYEFNYARLDAVDPNDGSVVVADTDNNRIIKYTNAGAFVWSVGGGGGSLGTYKNPHGIDVAPDGRIYVADTNNGRIQVLTADGDALFTIGTKGNGPGRFTRPAGWLWTTRPERCTAPTRPTTSSTSSRPPEPISAVSVARQRSAARSMLPPTPRTSTSPTRRRTASPCSASRRARSWAPSAPAAARSGNCGRRRGST